MKLARQCSTLRQIKNWFIAFQFPTRLWCIMKLENKLFFKRSSSLSLAFTEVNTFGNSPSLKSTDVMITLFYFRLKTTIRHFSGTIINDGGESRTNCVLCHPRAALHLAPSTARPGIHLHVNLLALSGLEAAASNLGGSVRLQLRMHCLLLLPFKCSRHANPPRLLATTVSKTPLTTFHANQEELKMRLDVLLPLGWTYATSPHDEVSFDGIISHLFS